MKIVIVGAGFTGIQLATLLVSEKNDVTLIDNNDEITRHATNRLDCSVVADDGNNIETLEAAGIAKADALVCLTGNDEVNMITCSLVDAIYPNILKIARVRNYAYYVNTAATQKTHATTFSGKHRPLYGIDYMIHPDVEAAEAIVKAVENGAVSNIVSFDNSEMQISKIAVEKGSLFANHTLKDIKNLCPVPLLVVYVEIGEKTSLPTGNSIMVEGCNIGVLTTKKDLSKVLECCGSKQKDLKKIAIIGAGRIGTLVAKQIVEPKKNSFIKMFSEKARKSSQKIVIIDSDEERTQAAAEKFPDCSVCCGDATDDSFLQEEHIPNFDLAICATHNHELNMVLAAYLESLGVKQSISLVTSAAFATIAQKLGVDVTVALRDVVVDSIMSHLRGNAVKEVHTITNSDLEIIECVMPENAKIAGKKVKELATLNGSSPETNNFLVLLNKHPDADDYEIAHGETIISSGDHLVIITQSDETKNVLKIFGE